MGLALGGIAVLIMVGMGIAVSGAMEDFEELEQDARAQLDDAEQDLDNAITDITPAMAMALIDGTAEDNDADASDDMADMDVMA